MLRRLVPALLVAAALHTPPAQAEGGFVFTGTAHEDCYGCGPSSGWFLGALTGVVRGHVYRGATVTISYTASSHPADCFITGTGSGVMTVTDGTRTDSWYANWTRSYSVVTLGGLQGAAPGSGSGVMTSTYVPVLPLGALCGEENVSFAMEGSGVVV